MTEKEQKKIERIESLQSIMLQIEPIIEQAEALYQEQKYDVGMSGCYFNLQDKLRKALAAASDTVYVENKNV